MSDVHEINKYILYADDDCEDHELFKDILAEVDADVELVSVNNGMQVLEFLESLKPGMKLPCLILLDLNMPMLNGIETLKAIKEHEHFRKLPVIIFSTSTEKADEQIAKKLGANDYVRKPVKLTDFRDVAIDFINRCDVVEKY
jgi:CheY-like chemotaxis protein